MKLLAASLLAMSLLGATAAQADELIGVGVHVGGIGVGANLGSDRGHDRTYHNRYRHSGYRNHGRCASWGWSHHHRYCRYYR